ncbi:DUF4178 domain-containing protein [Sphingomonas sp.]|uniref:DUF4178 domain-containing protein n=1 Tax=Sphingomonas sp. TaxID=28214 RepID=UPI003CC67753
MATRPGTVRALNCPNCGGTIALRAAGATVSLICEHCGSTLDATTPELRLVVAAQAAMQRPLIPLGTRGQLAGLAWEVVGYQERTDDEVFWSEYLLFNPYEGYAFLVDDGRRFSLGRLLTVLPGDRWGGLTLDGKSFNRFGTTYPVRTTFVVGEFYWRVAVGDLVGETDYVRDGVMLVCEESGNERTWTALDMQGWGVAERAFGLTPRAASYSGTPAPHEPSPYRTAMRDAMMIAALALAACIVIAIGTGLSTRVFARDLTVPLDEATHSTVLGPITVTAPHEKVQITGRAGNLDNMWVDLDYSLVNRQTQQSYDAYGLAESYHGTDSDGAWNEGNSGPETGLAAIPAGTYDLVVESAAHRWTDPHAQNGATGIFGSSSDGAGFGGSVPVSVTVDRGGGFAGPFFLAVLAIVIWPLIAWGRHKGFEKRRMAPVTGGGDDSSGDDDD